MTEAILILGMHRSGTSCLTGCLKSYGLQLGEVSEYNKNNPKGNQENRQVFRLNEAVLTYNGGSWHNPPSVPLMWDSELTDRRSEVLSSYRSLPKPWGIKDPRMLFAFDFWQEHLPAYQLIGTFRHPLAVANSLAARKKLAIPINEGFQLWEAYNQKLLKLHQIHHFPIVNFDWPDNLYEERVHQLAKSFALTAKPDLPFFDANLKNQSVFKNQDCPEQLLSTYNKLLKISEH